MSRQKYSRHAGPTYWSTSCPFTYPLSSAACLLARGKRGRGVGELIEMKQRGVERAGNDECEGEDGKKRGQGKMKRSGRGVVQELPPSSTFLSISGLQVQPPIAASFCASFLPLLPSSLLAERLGVSAWLGNLHTMPTALRFRSDFCLPRYTSRSNETMLLYLCIGSVRLVWPVLACETNHIRDMQVVE